LSLETYRVDVDGLDTVVEKSVAALARGDLIIMPTETVYGLAADPRRSDALELIYRAKSRDRGKPVAFLASGIEAIEARGFKLNVSERLLADRFWPGALTLVLRGPEGEEGFRVPDSPVALALLRAAGGVLRVTSANLSGEPDALTAETALRDLAEHVAIVIDAGPVSGGMASSVVRMAGGKPRILRGGAISEGDLASVLGREGRE